MQRAITSAFTLCLLLAASTVLAAERPQPASGSSPAKRILVTVKPLHSIVSALLDGITTPDLLLDGINSPHSYNLKPGDAQALHLADVIIWAGPALETYLAKPIALQQDRAAIIGLIDMAASLADSPDASTRKRLAHEQDGHFWLNPRRVLKLITPLAALLATQLPDDAGKIRQNAADLIQTLSRLDQSIAQRFKQRRNISALVYHDAWQHFLNRYQLGIQGVISTQELRQPGPAHLYRLQQTIKNKKTACLLIEPQYKPRYLKSLTAGSGIRVVEADPLGVAQPPGSATYLNIMKQIAAAFEQCLEK